MERLVLNQTIPVVLLAAHNVALMIVMFHPQTHQPIRLQM
jgi:hypothetical protein